MAVAYNLSMSRVDSFLGFVLGSDELLLVGVVFFLLFAGRKLPQLSRGLRIGLHEFRTALRQMDRGAHDAGRSAGGIFGKQAHEALTPDNRTAELYDPAVFDPARMVRPSFVHRFCRFVLMVSKLVWSWLSKSR